MNPIDTAPVKKIANNLNEPVKTMIDSLPPMKLTGKHS